MSESHRLAQMLRALASAVEALDDDQLESLIADLRRSGASNRRDPTNNVAERNRHSKIDSIELEQVLQRLSGMPTREDGARLLDDLNLSRKELQALARMRDVHIRKEDNLVRIKEKLVEVIIGSRLSSQAIRGE